jgi:hypothetical protein
MYRNSFEGAIRDRPEVPQWVKTQQNTFTNWCNTIIAKNERARRANFQPMTDLIQGLRSGVNLMYLTEQLTGRTAPFNEKPLLRIHCIQNVQTALNLLSESGVKLINISADEICNGNLKLILGLLWSMIRVYGASELSNLPSNVHVKTSTSVTSAATATTATITNERYDNEEEHKEKLKEWIKEMTGIRPNNFTTDFQDGTLLLRLVQRFQRDNGFPVLRLKNADSPLLRLTKALEDARDQFQIPIIMKPVDIVNSPDELSMITYLICINASIKDFKDRQERARSGLFPNMTNNNSNKNNSLPMHHHENMDDYDTFPSPEAESATHGARYDSSHRPPPLPKRKDRINRSRSRSYQNHEDSDTSSPEDVSTSYHASFYSSNVNPPYQAPDYAHAPHQQAPYPPHVHSNPSMPQSQGPPPLQPPYYPHYYGYMPQGPPPPEQQQQQPYPQPNMQPGYPPYYPTHHVLPPPPSPAPLPATTSSHIYNNYNSYMQGIPQPPPLAPLYVTQTTSHVYEEIPVPSTPPPQPIYGQNEIIIMNLGKRKHMKKMLKYGAYRISKYYI